MGRATIDDLLRITNFNRQEIESLIRNFSLLQPSNDKVDRSHFRDLLSDTFGIDDSLLMDRVFRSFDSDADNYISFDEFVRGMSVFLKGKLEEKMKFCFRVYDLNGDRYISKEEMFQMLQSCLIKGAEEDEDGVKDLVDLVLKKLDEDRDGRVSESDFVGAVSKENLLLEAFGQCLPTPKTIGNYLSQEALSLSLPPGSAKPNSGNVSSGSPASSNTGPSTLPQLPPPASAIAGHKILQARKAAAPNASFGRRSPASVSPYPNQKDASGLSEAQGAKAEATK